LFYNQNKRLKHCNSYLNCEYLYTFDIRRFYRRTFGPDQFKLYYIEDYIQSFLQPVNIYWFKTNRQSYKRYGDLYKLNKNDKVLLSLLRYVKIDIYNLLYIFSSSCLSVCRDLYGYY